MQVTRIDQPGENKRDRESPSFDEDELEDDDEDEDEADWSNFEGQRLPVVHFRGTSRSLHASWDPNANSKIRGTVRQTPEGEIRWTSTYHATSSEYGQADNGLAFSIFHGEERWRSEGIQVGGLRSARGVLGNWFDKVRYSQNSKEDTNMQLGL